MDAFWSFCCCSFLFIGHCCRTLNWVDDKCASGANIAPKKHQQQHFSLQFFLLLIANHSVINERIASFFFFTRCLFIWDLFCLILQLFITAHWAALTECTALLLMRLTLNSSRLLTFFFFFPLLPFSVHTRAQFLAFSFLPFHSAGVNLAPFVSSSILRWY